MSDERSKLQLLFLMLTAKSALEDRIEGLNAGAYYYLTKPFDTRELLSGIQSGLTVLGSYGLGLSIAQRIVEEHGGRIWAESSQGVNIFWVQLPVAM